MAIFSGTLYSKTLDMDTSFTVATPRKNLDFSKTYPAIYLLHGLTDCHASWRNNTQLSLLAEQYGVFFIMPDAVRSFYADAKYGLRYFTFISDELPQQCRNLFNISPSREQTGVMGLSMGGYGALRCALLRPDVFSFCGSFSACTDLRLIPKMVGEANPEACAVLGLQYEALEANNLASFVPQACKNEQKARYFATVGLQDDLLPMNEAFQHAMKNAGFDYTYETFAGGHDWYFWNTSLHKAMQHFFDE